VTDALEVAGCIGAAASVAIAILAGDRRVRALGLVAALGLATVLIAGQGWDDLRTLRDHPAEFAGVVVAGVLILAAGAAVLLRWPALLPVLLIAALPFRVRLNVAGGDEVNLLVPLYAVIGAGVLAELVAAIREGGERRPRIPRPLSIAIVAVVGLYALQTTYSDDISFAARNVGFFLVPFAVLFSLLAEVDWNRRLFLLLFGVVVAESVALALIGIGQYATEHIFWNEKLELSNDFHFYFRVNSLFWDPNIYGRYLTFGILVAATVVAWVSRSRVALGLAAAIAVIFAGLLFGFSQTSFIALFSGLIVLAALRWSFRWVAIATPVALAAVAAGVLFIGGGSGESADTVSEGHSSLISGGARLARDRPFLGYGSASFSVAFAREEDTRPGETTISHNEPITVAAEQGVVGVVAYLALLATAAWTLLAGIRRIAPGFGAPFKPIEEGDEAAFIAARIGIIAAFAALLVHTIGYAAYLTDPLTWVLFAIGGVLASETASPGPPQAEG
jgi:O-antigen ligase